MITSTPVYDSTSTSTVAYHSSTNRTPSSRSTLWLAARPLLFGRRATTSEALLLRTRQRRAAQGAVHSSSCCRQILCFLFSLLVCFDLDLFDMASFSFGFAYFVLA